MLRHYDGKLIDYIEPLGQIPPCLKIQWMERKSVMKGWVKKKRVHPNITQQYIPGDIPGTRSRWEISLSKTVNNKSDTWSNTESEMTESMKILFSAFQTRRRNEKRKENGGE